jgi:hypothetical protein
VRVDVGVVRAELLDPAGRLKPVRDGRVLGGVLHPVQEVLDADQDEILEVGVPFVLERRGPHHLLPVVEDHVALVPQPGVDVLLQRHLVQCRGEPLGGGAQLVLVAGQTFQ